MTHVGLAIGDWQRDVAREAQIPLVNRFFESDPVPLDGQAALLARPALRKWLRAGSGPIRGMFSQKGIFGDALFIVSGATLFRVNPDETIVTIGTGLFGNPNFYVPMCATEKYLFLADGRNLWVYTDNDAAAGTLTISGAVSAGEKVQVGSTWYQFTITSVDLGSPAGTSGAPWLVAVGASVSAALQNIADAIQGSGIAGTQYSTALTANPQVTTSTLTSTSLKIYAQVIGAGGNGIATTETLVNGSWGAATLTGGGGTFFSTVTMPDAVGAIWCDVIASFVIVVVAQGFDENGRFYWIQPGETTVDPLDFATAERAPDALYSVITLGDQFWLFGSSTTEIWYPTGDSTAPFERIQGRLFDRGIWSGTAIKVGDDLIVTDADGVVWRIGQGIKRISNNSIEERIREAMALELRG